MLLQYLVDQLNERGLPFFVLKKETTVLNATVDQYADVDISLLNRRSVLRSYIRRLSPATLLCFGNFPPPFRSGVRTITYFHNPHYVKGHDKRNFSRRHELNRILRRAYLQVNLHHSDLFVVQTPFIARAFANTFSVDQARIQVLPFYNQERIEAIAHEQEVARTVKQPRTFLYASSSEPHKNHLNLLKAWELLVDRGGAPVLYLTVSPSGPYTTDRLRSEISRLQAKGAPINNLGMVAYDDLLRLTYRCSACIFPSVNETLGLGLVESYWMGNAILASRRPYLPDVVTPSADFDPHDPAAIADAVTHYVREEPMPKPQLMLANRIDTFIDLLYKGRNSRVPGPMGADDRGAIAFHNDIATQFDNKYESSAAFGERFRVWTALFNRYIHPAHLVMDLGCGSGIFSDFLARRGCTVTGIDGSEEMINICRKRSTAQNVSYVLQSLPFTQPDTYLQQDAIIASSVLEYIDDMMLVVEQARETLKPDGLLLVSMPNKISLYRRVERMVFNLTKRPRYFAHLRNASTEACFNKDVAELGFDVLETVYFSSYDPLSRWLKWFLPRQYVNNLFVSVYRKR